MTDNYFMCDHKGKCPHNNYIECKHSIPHKELMNCVGSFCSPLNCLCIPYMKEGEEGFNPEEIISKAFGG